VTRSFLDYLTDPFTPQLFGDIFTPTWVAALVLLTALIILYNVRTRRLHRHKPYVDMWEWMLWTGISAFGLVLVGSIFKFEFWLVLLFEIVGVGALAWVRFRKFPPEFASYEHRLARQRFFSRTKFSRPESTVRQRQVRRSSKRRR
jgi:hypothetical protein